MINKPKGTKDIFGNEKILKNYIEEVVGFVANNYQYKFIDTPIFERKEVFFRSIGETSDIVSKEMFEFKDKGNRDMVLRPEATASVVRAIVENKLYTDDKPNKFVTIGPMFRYENPQKGRYRQFTQASFENIEIKSPYIDVETISTACSILKSLNINAKLHINSLGDKKTREDYSVALKDYFSNHKDKLSEISLERLEKNPLRILDDKEEAKKDFVKNSPKISKYYSQESKEYFETIQRLLKLLSIDYVIDNNLVRGLDYYTDTIFEFIASSPQIGSQSTVLAGGRYDNMIKNFGGPDKSSIGFALGIERVQMLMEQEVDFSKLIKTPDVYIGLLSEETKDVVMALSEMLRKAGISTTYKLKSKKIQKIFKDFDNSCSKILLLVGPKEIEKGTVIMKFNNDQQEVKFDNIISEVERILNSYEKN